MKRRQFFTSDWHLGSDLINQYASRPFVNQYDAAEKLVDWCNETAHWKTDVVFHVGDFFLRNVDRHGIVEDHNHLVASADEYLNFINASFVLLEGNHDTSNVECDLKSMTIDLNQHFRNVHVSHFPSYHQHYHGPNCSKWTFGHGIVLCGHVHDSWLMHYDKDKNVLNINVGVDVWDYRPVSDIQLTELLAFMTEQKLQKFDTSFYLTKTQLTQLKTDWKKAVEVNRKQRKEDRYARKGLTPEECQRRKEAAMKAKGLLL